ncbi:MAG: hypothetical protein JWM80_1708 [Cyanobacteria bacterium RYN_339]|nr:hypothetical protein [Cyanobacteria bacterium RYN_339]
MTTIGEPTPPWQALRVERPELMPPTPPQAQPDPPEAPPAYETDARETSGAAPEGVPDVGGEPATDAEFDALADDRASGGPNTTVNQYGPHSCVAATLQETWAANSPEGYALARNQMLETGTCALPGGGVATLGEENRAWLADFEAKNPGLTEAEKGNMAVQASLMELTTQGSYRIADDLNGKFDGLEEGWVNALQDAVCPGLETLSTNEVKFKEQQQKQHLAADDRDANIGLSEVDAWLAAGKQVIVRIAAADGKSAHAVRVDAAPGGLVRLTDGNGSRLVSRTQLADALEVNYKKSGTDGGGGGTGSGTRWRG